ncbi:hypothetical protein KEM52_006100 [Ascosphaera acerosa]|nr:hypothetical protein KEM52_006100 [Ascosphaera acerosa]
MNTIAAALPRAAPVLAAAARTARTAITAVPELRQSSAATCFWQHWNHYARHFPATAIGGIRHASDGPPKNDEIQATLVCVVNAEGRLDPPMTLRQALARIDLKTHLLLQMSPQTAEQPAVCKVASKAALYRREKEKRRQQKASRATAWKQLEINWGTGKHDLKQKFAKAREFVEHGRNVEIILQPKKRAQQATRDQATSLLREVKLQIIRMGGKETKPMGAPRSARKHG